MNHKSNFANVVLSALIGLTLILLAAWPVSVYAAASAAPDPSLDRFVAPTGTDAGDCSDSANPCATINYAISQAVPGQSIGVAEGTYTGTGTEVVLVNKSVNLSGGWNATFDAQTGYSAVDGLNSKNGMTITDQTAGFLTVSIENFMIFKTLWWGISNNENLTMIRSSIHSNTHDGIRHSSGELWLENSTVSNNKNYGLYIHSGTVNLNYVTISDHVTPYYPGIYKYTGVLNFKNTIMFNGNGGVSSSECWSMAAGDFYSLGHNIIGTTCGGAVEDPTDQFETNPILGIFLPLQGYHPILSNSPAIDTGDTTCDATDQRGVSRIDIADQGIAGVSCDIGAYEYTVPGTASSIWAILGDNQQTKPGSEFPEPLRVVVLDNLGSPVNGEEVTFTAPESGPSGAFAGSGTNVEGPLTTDLNGTATTSSLIANTELGTFVVHADAGLSTTADFTLENLSWYVSPSGSDVNSCKSPENPCATINSAVNKASNGDSIFVAVGVYIGSGTEVVLISKSLTLSGGWDETFTSQIGYSTIDGQNAKLGIRNTGKSNIDHFIITNGYSHDLGGGIHNSSSAELTITSIRVHGNYSRSWGGGIRNEGTMVLSNSVVYQNSSNTGGGGIYSIGTLTINNSTIAQNEKTGIKGDTIIINNSTITENSGGTAGGMEVYTTEIRNSIVANNIGGAPDCYGSVTSRDYNIIGDTSSCTLNTTSAGHDQLNVDPGLTVFITGVGYYILQPTSHAVDAGNPATPGSGGDACLSEDQRGAPRAENGSNGTACDVGAYEYTTPGSAASIWLIDGTPQVVPPQAAYPMPLRAITLDGQGSPVPGVSVTFTAPATGASGIFADTLDHVSTSSTDSGGLATSASFTANDQTGSYLVQAAVSGIPGTVDFSLHNGFWMVAPAGDNDNDCVTSTTPCATIQGVLGKPHFVNGNVIRIAVGAYDTDEDISIEKSISIEGGWDASFTSQIGKSTLEDPIRIMRNKTVSLSHLLLQNAYVSVFGFVQNKGILTLSESVIEDVDGYGVTNEGTLFFTGSTIANTRLGLYNTGTATVANSTISGNIGVGQGGGIRNTGSLTVLNSTIANNSAGNGGGIHNGTPGHTSIANSILAYNQSTVGATGGPDCYGSVTSQGYNIISAKSGCMINTASGDQFNVDPKLGTYQPEGYLLLEPGSPAIEGGNPAVPGSGGSTCLASDQRGVARPEGLFCDIGAVEIELYDAPPFSIRSTGVRDGWVLELTESSNKGGTKNSTGTLQVGDDDFNKQYRSLLYFNTAALPYDAVIIKVTLKIKKQGMMGTNPLNTHGNLLADIREGFFGAAALEVGDFQATATKNSVGKFNVIAGAPGWYRLIMGVVNNKYINLDGVTQFRLRFAKDDNNDRGADYVKFFAGDTSVPAANRPILIIEYMLP